MPEFIDNDTENLQLAISDDADDARVRSDAYLFIAERRVTRFPPDNMESEMEKATRESLRSLKKRSADKLEIGGFDVDRELEDLQILTSGVAVDEMKDAAVRVALRRIVEKFERLDDWMSATGELPSEWTARRDC